MFMVRGLRFKVRCAMFNVQRCVLVNIMEEEAVFGVVVNDSGCL